MAYKCPKCGLPANTQFYIPTPAMKTPDWQCERCQAKSEQEQEQPVVKWSARREGLVPMVEGGE